MDWTKTGWTKTGRTTYTYDYLKGGVMFSETAGKPCLFNTFKRMLSSYKQCEKLVRIMHACIYLNRLFHMLHKL